ncbi:MAG: metallophosphoesterase [Velocimicrobium sp.]
MKLAIMSDIHSNIVAFEACLTYINQNPVDAVILLGDFVSDCPDPRLTLGKIYELMDKMPVYAVRGNREEYFLRYRDGIEENWTSSSYKGSLLYTYERLNKQDLDWFDSLTSTRILHFPDTEPIRLAHGSPYSTRELLDDEKENTKECLQRLDTKYLLAGHTHRQMSFGYKGKMIINPGSVGVAIGVKKRAHMAYLSWNQNCWDYEFLSIPFSFERVVNWFRESTLFDRAFIWPTCILKSMELGENMGPLCAKRAYDLAVANQALSEDGNPPEEYWRRAAGELGVI